MRKIVTITMLFFVGVWLLLGAILSGIYFPNWLPEAIRNLKFPSTTADLGQSFSILDGLLSSVAIILGLVAIILQGRQQSEANKISAYTARMQFLLADNDRLQSASDNLTEIDTTKDPALRPNMLNKKSRQLKEIGEMDQKIQDLIQRL